MEELGSGGAEELRQRGPGSGGVEEWRSGGAEGTHSRRYEMYKKYSRMYMVAWNCGLLCRRI